MRNFLILLVCVCMTGMAWAIPAQDCSTTPNFKVRVSVAGREYSTQNAGAPSIRVEIRIYDNYQNPTVFPPITRHYIHVFPKNRTGIEQFRNFDFSDFTLTEDADQKNDYLHFHFSLSDYPTTADAYADALVFALTFGNITARAIQELGYTSSVDISEIKNVSNTCWSWTFPMINFTPQWIENISIFSTDSELKAEIERLNTLLTDCYEDYEDLQAAFNPGECPACVCPEIPDCPTCPECPECPPCYRRRGSAEPEQVLSGVEFSNYTDVLYGKMPDNGNLLVAAGAGIPKGYHNGTGKCSECPTCPECACPDCSVCDPCDSCCPTPPACDSCCPDCPTCPAASTGTADTAHVLAGQTFSNSAGVGLAGSMSDRGSMTVTPGSPIPAGYHNGSGQCDACSGCPTCPACDSCCPTCPEAPTGDADVGDVRAGKSFSNAAGVGLTGTWSPIIASGTAAPDQVRSGVAFSNASGTQTGTMPDATGDIVPGAADQTIPAGYHDGTGLVSGDADLVAGNIISGAEIFGTTGTFECPTCPATASGTATSAHVLSGLTFSNDIGNGLTGIMPNNGAWDFTPGISPMSVPSGYHNGSGMIAGDADLIAGNIRSGANVFGVEGSVIPASGTADTADVRSGVTFSNASGEAVGSMPDATLSISPGTVSQSIPAGFHDGTGNVAGDSDLIAENIRNGVEIFGITGSYEPASCTGDATDGDVRDGVTYSNDDGASVGTWNPLIASGDATPADVRSGVSFSNASGSQSGSMPDGTDATGADGSLSVTIPEGYHDGTTRATATDSDLIASNIREGVEIFGVTGTHEDGYPYAYNMDVVSALDPRYTDNGDGTVTDNATGRMWIQNGDHVGDWDGAVSHCAGLTLGGHTDWRLPTIAEIFSITDYTTGGPVLDGDTFDASDEFFWGPENSSIRAWQYGINDGGIMSVFKTDPCGVAFCVRTP